MECAIPLQTLGATPVATRRLLIVENKVNLLTLPSLTDSVTLSRTRIVDAIEPQTADRIGRCTDGSLSVLEYSLAHPQPEVFARELPFPLATKFLERNERVLQEWFDHVFPPHAIRADESHFTRRYGLRYPEPHILIRFLDSRFLSSLHGN